MSKLSARRLIVRAAFVLPALLLFAGQPSFAAPLPSAGASADYIVTFRASTNVDLESRDFRNQNGEVKGTYSKLFKGMTVKANASELSRLRQDPNVLAIEQDSVVTAQVTQAGATWGIDRVDQYDLPLDKAYSYSTSGLGVQVFVVDTGVRATHVELAGRVDPGITMINDGLGTSDGNGHGTHVSATIAGTTYGLAKAARIVPVRVLDSKGSGTSSGVISGLNWIATQITQGTTKAVVNMSLGGTQSPAVNAAVESLVALGVTVVVASGNSAADACASSPASAPSAITVSATDSADRFATYSNFGSCVDILAPGTGITSAWGTSNTATNTISGTSMASPHVAGAAALLLEAGYKTPGEITTALLGNAVANTITAVPGATPNKFLYTGTGTTPPPPVVGSLPGAPTQLQATAGTRQASLKWVAGAPNGGTPSAQTLTVFRIGSTTPVATLSIGAQLTTATVSGLSRGSSYNFTLTLTTQFGTSLPSAVSNTVVVR
jgi:subtilisin family serine protease